MAWCFVDEASDDVQAVFSALRFEQAVVPAVWTLEISNALAVARKRKRVADKAALDILDVLSSLPILIEPAPTLHDTVRLLTTANQYGLSTYDAAYLDLAVQKGCPLATLDERLRKARHRAGVPRFDPAK
jgi:predicted nucleic acid-binding protein